MNDRALSVLFLVDRWIAGGARKHINDLCREFHALGMDCAVAGWLPPGDNPPVGLEFHHLPLFSESGNKSLSGLYKSVIQLRRLVRAKRFDIIHLHSRFVTLVAAAMSPGLSLVRVYTSHSTFCDLRFLPWYPQHVICLNETGKQEFLRNHFLPRNIDVAVISNGIEVHPDAARLDREPEQASFTYIGRLEKQKGVDLILHAVAKLRDTGIHITIAGSGSQEKALHSLSHKLGLDRQVEFLGFVDDPDTVLDLSSALILPATGFEGFGYVILEAFARHRAVIAGDMAVFDDTVRDGVTGIRFKTGDHPSLAVALRRAMKEREQLKTMGENGFSLLCEKFTLQTMVEATLAVYTTAVGTRQPMSDQEYG